MRAASVVLFLLAFASLYSAQTAGCPTCSALTGRPQAQLTPFVDGGTDTLTVTTYYENLTDGSRPLIGNAVLVLQVMPGNQQNQLYIISINSAGQASFDFHSIYSDPKMAGNCTRFKIVYCPFCIPQTPTCGFQACLDYARIGSDKTQYSNIPGAGTIQSIDDIPVAPGSSIPATQGDIYLPQAQLASYCPPPLPQEATPALCLPLIIIFSLLSGALYVTGRNPFAGFSLGGARIGRHIRYMARGRGVSVSTQAIASAVQTAKSAHDTKKKGEAAAIAKAKAEGKKLSNSEIRAAGRSELRQTEANAAKGRVFLISDIKKGLSGINAARSASAAVAAASQKAKEAGKPLTSLEKSEVRQRHMEAVLSGGIPGGLTATGKGAIQLPSMGSIRGSELIVMSKNLGAKGWAGIGGYFATIGGTLGKTALFLVLTSPLFQLVEAVRMVATPQSSYKPLSEVILVNHAARAANDMQALKEMNAAGGTPVRLPNGKVATLVGMETLKDENGKVTGTKIYLLADKEKAFTLDGLLTITIDNKGKIDSFSCNTKDGVLALMANPAGGPMLVTNPEMTTMKTGKDGNPVGVVEVNPNAKQIGTQPAPNQPQQDKLAWANAAAPITAAINAIGGPSIFASLGTSGSALVKECARDVNSVRAINSSLGSELGYQIKDIEKDLMKKYSPEQQKTMLASERDKIAEKASFLALARTLSPEASMTLKASPFSNTGTLGVTLADQAGFNKDHGFTQKEVSAMGAAIGIALAGKSAADIAALAQNPEQLKTILSSALSLQGISKADAPKMLNESAINGISAGIADAVHENARAPVKAVDNALERSPLSSLFNFSQEKSEKAHFTEAQSQAIAGYLAQNLGMFTISQLEGVGKEPGKVKEIATVALASQLEHRLKEAGATTDEAKKAADFTLRQVTSLDLKKDPLAGGRTPTGDVAYAVSIVTNQLLSCGLSKGDARKEAESMVRGMSDPAMGGIATAISEAAQRVSSNLAKEGFTPGLVSELKGVTMGQLGGMASASNVVSPPNGINTPSQFAELLAKDRSNAAIPADVRNMLEQREFVLSAQAQSGQLDGSFKRADQNGYVYMPGMSGQINSLGNELANSYNSQMATVLSADKTFKKLDPPDSATGHTITGDLASGNEHQADASRLERLMGELVPMQSEGYKVGDKATTGERIVRTWDPLLSHEEKVEILGQVEQSQRGQLRNSLAAGDLPGAQSVCAERVKFYRELGDTATAGVWEKALTDVGGLRREGGQPASQQLLGSWISDELSKSFAKPIADHEQQQRVEFKTALDHNDLSAAGTLAYKQSEYYRSMGDTKSADAWDNAYKTVVDLFKVGDKVSQNTTIDLVGKIGQGAGSPDDVAQGLSSRVPGAANVMLVEADRMAASYYSDNALTRASEVLAGTPAPEAKASPVRMAAGGGGGEEPPSKPPASGVEAESPRAATGEDKQMLDKFREQESEIMKGTKAKEYGAAYADTMAKMYAVNAGENARIDAFTDGLKNIAHSMGRPEAEVTPATTKEIVSEANHRMLNVIPDMIKLYDEQIAKNPAAAMELTHEKAATLASLVDVDKNGNSLGLKEEVKADIYNQVVMEHLKIPMTQPNVNAVRESVGEARQSAEEHSMAARDGAYTKLMTDYKTRVGEPQAEANPPPKASKKPKEG